MAPTGGADAIMHDAIRRIGSWNRQPKVRRTPVSGRLPAGATAQMQGGGRLIGWNLIFQMARDMRNIYTPL